MRAVVAKRLRKQAKFHPNRPRCYENVDLAKGIKLPQYATPVPYYFRIIVNKIGHPRWTYKQLKKLHYV